MIISKLRLAESFDAHFLSPMTMQYSKKPYNLCRIITYFTFAIALQLVLAIAKT